MSKMATSGSHRFTTVTTISKSMVALQMEDNINVHNLKKIEVYIGAGFHPVSTSVVATDHVRHYTKLTFLS